MSLISKPTSKVSTFTFILLLLLSFVIIVAYSSPDSNVEANEPGSGSGSDEDLEQLLAVDEQLQEDHRPEQQSEAKTVSKAQRIVLELNGDNAKRVINGNEFVMVLGYAPWCARSAELMPRFAEAATALKEIGSSILMAKIDGDRYSKIASEFEIRGFPTLLLFVNGTSQTYNGGSSAEDIVIWVQKKTGAPIITVNTVDEAQSFLKKYHTFVLGLFEKLEGSEHNEFVKAAKSDDEIQFVQTSNSDVAKLLFPDLKTNNVFIGMVKTEAERFTVYDGSYKMEKILEFLGSNKFPLITKLTDTNTVWVYSSPVKLQVMLFSKAADFQKIAQPLEDIARKLKSKLMFIYVDITNENLAMPFLTLFGIEDANKTVVAAFDNNLNSKYLLESDATPNNIEEFCSGLAHGTVSRYYRSEPIPDNENASIVTVVGKTFDELVLNSHENVLLEVHTPWCVKCEAVSKQVEKLAKHFKGFENLVFARIDASANEHTKLEVDDEYPMILLYKSGEKEKPLKLSTKLSAKDMAVFINEELKPKDGSAAKDEL
ncbi:PREDICTED: protein disulfide isomerase-like 1-5 [Camelina sativa]|uniref:Protein disulfide isomerase-like 1-5 n=1 Tax=Camelina sativa TaxID=90675 RepID=A0ABM0X2R0_CAMSA|nr:PREDICTED: protein disulfide isomerase-like 1-5 [Camelina sativa]